LEVSYRRTATILDEELTLLVSRLA